jgi:KDO2-lipid IV(A) lauroyltransferase
MYLLKRTGDLLKTLFYQTMNILLKLVLFFCNHLPEKVLAGIFTSTASLFFLFSRRYRNRVRNNIQIAFGPAFDNHKAKNLLEALANNCGISALETLFSATDRREKVLNSVSIQGRENLDRALAGGKGVVGVSAHLGNFTLMSPKMVDAGYPFTMLVKEFSDKGVARTLRKIQNMQRGRYIYIEPWKPALREILECLRKNEIICFLSDERKKHSEVSVDFFGHPVATATGAAVFSLKAGAPLIPIFMVRHENGSHTIFIEPQLDVPLSGNQKEDIISLTAAFTKVIETYVRKYPDQWFWLNNRWRWKGDPKGITVVDNHMQ